MTERERDDVARVWREKYGEPIDCEELKRTAPLEMLRWERFEWALCEALPDYLNLLARQLVERSAFLRTRLRGRSHSLKDLWDELSGAEKRVKRVSDSQLELGLAVGVRVPWFIHWYNAQQEQLAGDIKQLTALTEVGSADTWAPMVETKAQDIAWALVVEGVAEWIRDHTLSGRCCWSDVRLCLLWYGHEVPDEDHNHRLQKAERQAKRAGRAYLHAMGNTPSAPPEQSAPQP